MAERVPFNSEAEARAFRQGVEYVNDSAIEVVNLGYDGVTEKWFVDIVDDDRDDEPEESPEDTAELTNAQRADWGNQMLIAAAAIINTDDEPDEVRLRRESVDFTQALTTAEIHFNEEVDAEEQDPGEEQEPE
jgi:glycosyltransferase involved in cell wall biosynthesis